MMPVMDGLEFYTEFKRSEKNKTVPFIFLTAIADYETRLEALILGVDEYVQKPFAPRELLIRLERLLHFRQMRVEEKAIGAPEEIREEFSVQEKFLRKFKTYVEQNLGEATIKITDLCDEMAVSERQLHYKIKSLTGATPANLVKEIKLQYVRRLLEKSQVSTVAEAAYSVGFENVTHFSKLFEQRFGKKPSSYF
jgi:transcriptional regulator GlxA family with amidase domain